MKLAIALIAALGLVVGNAPAGVPSGGPNTFACKVLRNAIAGTPLGQRATRYQLNGSGPNACRLDTGQAGGLWVAQGGFQNYGSALARRLVRQQCAAILTVTGLEQDGDALTKAESGADVACRLERAPRGSRDVATNNIVFAKGRWYGELSTATPGRFGPILSVLRKFTSQLPR